MNRARHILKLTGRIFFAEGGYHCELPEIGQITWGDSAEDVARDSLRVVTGYFNGCEKIGIFEKEMIRLIGVAAPMSEIAVHLTLNIDVPVSDVPVPVEARNEYDFPLVA